METKLILIFWMCAFVTTAIAGGLLSSPPKFKRIPIHDDLAVVDGSHKFVCKVKGSPKPFLVWYHGNVMLTQNNRIKIGKYSLQISNLQTSDSGEYACRASNIHGVIWGNFTLQVTDDKEEVSSLRLDDYETSEFDHLSDVLNEADLFICGLVFHVWGEQIVPGPPAFKRRFNQVSYLARAATSSVDFECDVLAYPEATISWTKNGIKVEEQPDKYIFDGYKLTVKSLTSADSGGYTCVVRNEYGSVNWTTRLEVQQKISIAPIMEDVKNRTALVGDNVTFTCQIVMSDSQPLLQWLRHFKENGSYTKENGEPYVKILQSSGFKSTIDDPQHLVLHNVTKEDEGWYTCLVANTVGMNYRSAWLTVLEIDCEVNNGDCHTHATCDSSEWVVSCSCKPGYTGDGYTCSNVDECSGAFYPCLRDYTCEDQDPGYSCVPQVKSEPSCTNP